MTVADTDRSLQLVLDQGQTPCSASPLWKSWIRHCSPPT